MTWARMKLDANRRNRNIGCIEILDNKGWALSLTKRGTGTLDVLKLRKAIETFVDVICGTGTLDVLKFVNMHDNLVAGLAEPEHWMY